MKVTSNEAFRAGWLRDLGASTPKILCVGLNYRGHAAEAGKPIPAAPLFFAKAATALIGDGEAIVLPAGVGHVDAEAELAVVIGTGGRRLNAREARAAIAGYTCANDVSARDVQYTDGQWFRAKSLDTFCPIGPRVIPAGELDSSRVRVQQRLNGETIQDESTGNLIFDVPALVAYVSRWLTLERGDIILTGTPAGVGVARKPKVALAPGDLVEVEIEGIGVLRNEVREG